VGSSPSAPASPPAVTIHIGAHKTASTHLQKALLAHRDELAAMGCCYIGPDTLRKRHAYPAPRKAEDRAPANPHTLLQALATARRAGQRVVLSDENILGRPRPPFIAEGSQLYPQAAPRIAHLISSLGLQNVTLALCLRDPLGFLISAHGHQALAGHPVCFDAFVDGIDPLALRWPELISRLLGCAGVSHILLWRYEAYPEIAPVLAEQLLGDARACAWLGADGPRLLGISAQAWQQARALIAEDPARDPKKTVKQQMRKFPKSAQYPPLQPFSSAQVAQSRSQYDSDWKQLALWPRVTCLTL